METKEQIYTRMIQESPYNFSSRLKPYILEAMQIYADQYKKITPKTKPIEERKQEFREKAFKYLDQYSESMMIEFFDSYTCEVKENLMHFENIEGFNLEKELKKYYKL